MVFGDYLDNKINTCSVQNESKTDELVAEKEAKEVSEAIKDLDILTEKARKRIRILEL